MINLTILYLTKEFEKVHINGSVNEFKRKSFSKGTACSEKNNYPSHSFYPVFYCVLRRLVEIFSEEKDIGESKLLNRYKNVVASENPPYVFCDKF